MSQPTPYARQFDFTGWSTSRPNTPHPGVQIDAELNAVRAALNHALTNLALIQRDDTGLANGVVGIDQLSAIVQAMLAGGGFTVRGNWAASTAYLRGDIVADDGKVYLVITDHNSSVSLAADIASGYVSSAIFEPHALLDYMDDLAASTGAGLVGSTGGITVQAALDLKAALASPTFTGTPAAPTAALGTDTTQIATTAFVQDAVQALLDASPGTLDTLNELAAALGDDANFAATTATSLGSRVQYVTSRANLAAAATTPATAFLTESGREGTFVWSSANNSANVTADPGQGIYVPPSSDTTGASGAWVRKYTTGIFMVEWWGATGDGTTDDETSINRSMATVNYLNGGAILFGAKTYLTGAVLDNKFSRVRLVGVGWNTFHDAGTETARTIIKTNFAGTGLKIRTPYFAEQGVTVGNSYKYTGAGCVGISFDGNGVATKAIEIDSVSGIDVDVYATGYVGTTVYEVKCGVTNTDLGEACDVQYSRMVFRARQIDTAGQKSSHILTLNGSSNANVSVNRGPLHGITVVAQHWDGHALRVISADNNDITVWATRPGGSGKTIHGNGPTASIPVGCEGNNFVYVAGGGAVYVEGTDVGGVTAGVINRIEHLDTGNGTPAPTQGTGSSWQYTENNNVTAGEAFFKAAFGDSLASAKAARAAMGTETVRIRNGSSNHFIFDNGTESWAVNIDAATGNLRVQRLAGSGLIDFTYIVNTSDGYRYAGTPVVGARKTGWSVDTGTAKRTANATYSGTASAGYVQAEMQAVMDALRDATQTIKALKDDLHGTAGHGLIGT